MQKMSELMMNIFHLYHQLNVFEWDLLSIISNNSRSLSCLGSSD